MELRSLAEKIFTDHPSRFTKKEKQALHATVRSALVEAGWKDEEIKIQKFKGAFGSQNVVIGNPNAEYIITGHYDTPGCNGFMFFTSPLLGQTGANIALFPILFAVGILVAALGIATGNEIIAPLVSSFAGLAVMLIFIIPTLIKNRNNRNDNTSGVLGVLSCAALAANNPELKEKCCFVLFDNEEWGLIGSSQFAKWCKKNGIDTKKSTVINLDCIGVGDRLVAARTGKRHPKQAELLAKLRAAGLEITEKQSSMVYMSDHANFQNSYMFSYMRKSAIGALYMPNIHTPSDKECDVEQIEKLSEGIMAAISR